MFRTIALGTCVSVQGKVVDVLKDGRVTVQVGEKSFTGLSVIPMTKAISALPITPALARA